MLYSFWLVENAPPNDQLLPPSGIQIPEHIQAYLQHGTTISLSRNSELEAKFALDEHYLKESVAGVHRDVRTLFQLIGTEAPGWD